MGKENFKAIYCVPNCKCARPSNFNNEDFCFLNTDARFINISLHRRNYNKKQNTNYKRTWTNNAKQNTKFKKQIN